ncbi:hypothetical protein HWV23_16970 [Natronomonas halophila]|uniref:PKD domain-containing protein n=1 Tax=Natronomonas halophila TaxID=2747817 RepID=UPI0015B70FAF|nr:PKD domain-containing protein [Natronomonas halophila]QLD87344.1 hypothetical protein HWV23_16970 [Natronomonas halophila]
MADAGLDQSVPVDTTVQLDATGSTHPEGDIESYEWHIETPDGRDIDPDCTACARTTFTPNTTGQYEVTVTVTGSEGETASDTLYVDVEGAPAGTSPGAGSPEMGREISYDSGDGTDPVEIEYTVQNPETECIHDAAGETATGYARASAIENCDTGDVEWEVPVEGEKQKAEVVIEISDYQSIDSGGLLPSGNNQEQTIGSEGMGQTGHSNPIVGNARKAQEEETGPVENLLYGMDSAKATTYETTGNGAQAVANLESMGSQFYQLGQSEGRGYRYQDIKQTAGPTGEELTNTDQVSVTVEAGDGEGAMDFLGLSDTYSREDYEEARSSVSDITDSIGSELTDTVGYDHRNSENSGSNDEEGTTHETQDSTFNPNDSPSDDSEERDDGHTTGSPSNNPPDSGISSSHGSKTDNDAGYVAPQI